MGRFQITEPENLTMDICRAKILFYSPLSTLHPNQRGRASPNQALHGLGRRNHTIPAPVKAHAAGHDPIRDRCGVGAALDPPVTFIQGRCFQYKPPLVTRISRLPSHNMNGEAIICRLKLYLTSLFYISVMG